MKNRLYCFICCELWLSHSAVKDSKNQQFFPLKISTFLTFHTSLLRELKNVKVLLIWWLLTEMAGLDSIYWLMVYLSEDSFILKINFDIWSLRAEDEKKRKWWGRRKWLIFFSLNGEVRKSKDLYKEPTGWSLWL